MENYMMNMVVSSSLYKLLCIVTLSLLSLILCAYCSDVMGSDSLMLIEAIN